ncbi:MAG: ATP-binding protein, partial [Muribaculaceae bacterium]|nr:ATP-binding protein [Muribaculaceae bacterium]
VFQIKKQLGISGVNSNEYTWRCEDEDYGAQIDLIIERADNTVNLCEMKFSIGQFSIDKDYESNLRNKLSKFVEHTKMKKSIQITLITTYGIKNNQYSGIVNNQVTLDNMFS